MKYLNILYSSLDPLILASMRSANKRTPVTADQIRRFRPRTHRFLYPYCSPNWHPSSRRLSLIPSIRYPGSKCFGAGVAWGVTRLHDKWSVKRCQSIVLIRNCYRSRRTICVICRQVSMIKEKDGFAGFYKGVFANLLTTVCGSIDASGDVRRGQRAVSQISAAQGTRFT